MKRTKPDFHRTLTPKQIAAQQAGGRRIAPGLWLDAEGSLHYSVTELLALVDLEDTPANRDAVRAIVVETLRAQNPSVLIIRQDRES